MISSIKSNQKLFFTLFLSYLLVSFFFSFQNFIFFKDLQKVVDNSKDLYIHPFTVNIQARDIKQKITLIRTKMLYASILKDLSSIQITEAEVYDLDFEIKKSMEIIEKSFLGDLNRVSQLNEDIIYWNTVRGKILLFYKLKDYKKANKVLISEATFVYERLKDNIDYIIDFSSKKASFFIDQNLIHEKQAIKNVWVFTVSSFFISLFLGFLSLYLLTKKFKIDDAKKYNLLEKFKIITDKVPGFSTFFLNNEGLIQSWNEGSEKLYGFEWSEVLGKKFSIFDSSIHPEENLNFYQLIQKMNDHHYEFERWQKRKDKSLFFADIILIKSFDEKNLPNGFVLIIRDITNLKSTLIELEVAKNKTDEANKARGLFLANMSHEIRTPLNGILGIAELMKDDLVPKEDFSKNINIIFNSGKHLLHTLNDILDFSKIEAGEIKLELNYFDPEKLISDTCNLYSKMAESKNIQLNYSLDIEEKNQYVGDYFRLHQVLANLICNSIKFTDQGSVKVFAQIKKTNIPNQDYTFYVQIQDTGIGIEPDHIDKIFTKFTQIDPTSTRKYGGTGLGLSIAQKLCNLMKGNLGVMSEKGKGSTFWFKVPLQKPKVEYCAQNALTNLNPAHLKRPLNILVIEDNEINAIVIGKYLDKLGHQYQFAVNGQKGVDLFKKIKFDLVLMDCQMPVMDGYEATTQIRIWEGENKIIQTPVIALSAAIFPEEIDKCYSSGMNYFIKKPLNMSTLSSSIMRACKDFYHELVVDTEVEL
jgi:PAS domain S-box-containing protein